MENLGINYQQAQKLVGKHVTDPITKMHLRETEVIMRSLAKKLGEDEEQWGIIGLLHDIDWDKTKDNPGEHCARAVDILREAGAADFLIESVESHGYGHPIGNNLKDKTRTTKLQYCLAAAETLTGLVIAGTLVQPDRKLKSVKPKSLKKKFKDKSFAANCNRDVICECEKAGILLDEFLEIGLVSLQGIADELGL